MVSAMRGNPPLDFGSGFLPQGGIAPETVCPPQRLLPPEIWSENNRKISITIDFAPSGKNCWKKARAGGSVCSKIKSKGKKKTTKFRNISDNGYLDWLLHQNVFAQRESNSMLSDKGKEFSFEEASRSPFTELAFEFYKEFM